jgi:hypothetical protein
MKNTFILLALMLVVASCKNGVPDAAESNETVFGAELSDQTITSYTAVLDKLDQSNKLENVKIKAKVEEVCQAKGCWMNLVSDDAPDAAMFVKFKDYGFFVPKDIAGREVIIEGAAYYEETSVDELKHYAEDKGESEEAIAAITEPVKELKFMATGVKLLP